MGGQTNYIVWCSNIIQSGCYRLMESHHVPVAVRLLVAVCLIARYCSGEYGYTCTIIICSKLVLPSKGQCKFEYRAQPLSSTVHGCNPYNGNLVIRIPLECVAKRQMNVAN